MLKSILIFILALSIHARAEGPLENEINEIDEIENAVPDESHVDTAVKPKAEMPLSEKRDTSDMPPDQRSTSDMPPSQHRQNENAIYTEKSSSSSGEPIYDWSKHQGENVIDHPFAGKGLIRITKDKDYIYKVKEGEGHQAMSLQVGMLDPVNLRNPNANVGSYGSTFKDNYSSTSNPTVLLTKEWDGWIGALGKINWRIGSGAFVAQGHGHFVSSVNQDKEPLENLTFIAFPNSAGVVYRMQFYDRPLLVPFVEGGVTGWVFTEIRDDKKGPKFGVAPSGYAAAGVAVNMTYFDYLSRIHIDREYGITGVFFTAEFRRMQAIVDRYDFSGNYVNAGFLMQY